MGVFDSFLNGAKRQMESTARSLGREVVNKAISSAKKVAADAINKDKKSDAEDDRERDAEPEAPSERLSGVKDVRERLEEAGMEQRAEALGEECKDVQSRLDAAAASGDMRQVTGALRDLMGFAGKAGHAQMDGVAHVADFLSDASGGDGKLSGFAEATRAVGDKLESDGEKIKNGS